jgi:membrane associated rhomboid family serine protease
MRMPLVTKIVLIALAVAFGLQQLAGDLAMTPLLLWPVGDQVFDIGDGRTITLGFRPWQLVTYALLHADLMHLLFNALALYQFGPAIEQAWGARRFAVYLLVCVVGAGLLQLVVATFLPPGEARPVLGASGGMYAILLAFGMLFPKHRLMLIIPPIPMSARTMVIVFGAISLLLGITGAQAGVAHFVHLGGLLVGWLLIQLWLKPRRPRPDRGPSTYV